jgi:glycerol-3-phosphate dehydrogenase
LDFGCNALLGGFDTSTRFGAVPRREWTSLDGLADPAVSTPSSAYHDAQTDDALLTRAVVQSALSLGAELAMPASFKGAVLSGDGVTVTYDQGGSTLECAARVLVNAAGPWATRVAGFIQPSSRFRTWIWCKVRTSCCLSQSPPGSTTSRVPRMAVRCSSCRGMARP